jgi:mannose-6-phosphate isomerase-like protein (cupin superfamily)
MGTRRTPAQGVAPSRDELERRFREEGLWEVRWWSNGPGDTFGWHDHPFHKVLFCSEGSIVFHTRDGDVELRPGDRLDIEPGTEHSATVGPDGVSCVEAPRAS